MLDDDDVDKDSEALVKGAMINTRFFMMSNACSRGSVFLVFLWRSYLVFVSERLASGDFYLVGERSDSFGFERRFLPESDARTTVPGLSWLTRLVALFATLHANLSGKETCIKQPRDRKGNG